MYFKKALYQKYISGEDNVFGHQYYAFLGKVSGKFQSSIVVNSIDDEFDNNDFGFLSRNNQLQLNGDVSYTENNPKNIFSSYTFYGNYQSSYYQSLLAKETRYYQIGAYGTFKKSNHTFFADFTYQEKGKDFYEARIEDRFFNTAARTHAFLEYQTNPSKRVSFAGYAEFISYLKTPLQSYNVSLGYGIRSRIGQHLYIYLGQSYQRNPNNLGYLTSTKDEVLFGQRDYKILNNELLLNYAINSKISMSTTFRHYWAQIAYAKQYELTTDGNLINNNTAINLTDFNTNYNSFSIDFIAKWQFSPASEMSLGYKLGTIYNDGNVTSSYGNNLNTTLKEDGNHTVSFKVTYFIDYNSLKTKKLF